MKLNQTAVEPLDFYKKPMFPRDYLPYVCSKANTLFAMENSLVFSTESAKSTMCHLLSRSQQELRDAIRDGLLYMDMATSRPRSPHSEYSPR